MPHITLTEPLITVNDVPVEREYEYVVEGNTIDMRGAMDSIDSVCRKNRQTRGDAINSLMRSLCSRYVVDM